MSKDRRSTEWRQAKRAKKAELVKKAKRAEETSGVALGGEGASALLLGKEDDADEESSEDDEGSDVDGQKVKSKCFNWTTGTSKVACIYMESRWQEFASDSGRRTQIARETAEYVASHYTFAEHRAGDVRSVRSRMLGTLPIN